MENMVIQAGKVIGNNWLALVLIAIFITWRVSREVNKVMTRFDAFDAKLTALEELHKLEIANRDKLCCDRLKLIEKNKSKAATRQLKIERMLSALNSTVKKHCTMLTKLMETIFSIEKPKSNEQENSLETVKENT